MSEHTPLPWSIDAIGNIWAENTKVAETADIPSAALIYRQMSVSEHAKNREFIVKACNLHDEMVELLEAIKDENDYDDSCRTQYIFKVRELLAKAKGESK